MDYLAGYGSSSDDDEDISSSITAKKPPAVTQAPQPEVRPQSRPLASTTVAAGCKKGSAIHVASSHNNKKKLNISILPPEIQAALMRNESLKDSDDEDDMRSSSNTASSSGNISQSRFSESNELLRMLPQPNNKSKSQESDELFAGPSAARPGNVSKEGPIAASSKTVFKAAITQSVTSKKTAPSSARSVSVSSSSSSSSSTSSSSSSSTNSSVAAVAAPVVVEDWRSFPTRHSASSLPVQVVSSHNGHNNQLNDTHTRHVPVHQSEAPVGPTYMPAQQQQQQQTYYNNSNNYNESSLVSYAVADNYNDYSSDNNNIRPGSKKRGRERELEQQLMSGNLDALPDGSVREVVNSNQSWNAQQYMQQQQEAASVQKSFGLTSSMKAITQPTKTQKSKHQLGSLAIQAAQTELKMLENRGAKAVGRTQTEKQYGW